MPVSQSQRLRKAAAKAAKRKAVVAEKRVKERRELKISKPRHVDLASSPIAHCLLTADIENVGLGTLIVVRKLSLGRYGTAVFLLDLWCLGVKDAFFRVDEADDFNDFHKAMEFGGPLQPIAPERARRLLRDVAAFGAANGFPPPAEFAEVERLLGDVESGGEPFAFGDNGRPHYVVAETDLRRDTKYILARLTEKLGPGGFDVTYPLDDGEWTEAEDEEDERLLD
jgi:hypothetical protein